MSAFKRFFVAAMLSVTAAHAADPKTEAEMNQRFPLPEAFEAEDNRNAVLLAVQGAEVLRLKLRDYSTARFQNVKAVLLADWRSFDRFLLHLRRDQRAEWRLHRLGLLHDLQRGGGWRDSCARR